MILDADGSGIKVERLPIRKRRIWLGILSLSLCARAVRAFGWLSVSLQTDRIQHRRKQACLLPYNYACSWRRLSELPDSETPCYSEDSPWGGPYSESTATAAALVSHAVQLCREVQEEWFQTKVNQNKDKAIEKDDGSPVTAVDLAIQGYIFHQLHKKYPNCSFLGEEDASALRTNPELQKEALRYVQRLCNFTDSASKTDQQEQSKTATSIVKVITDEEFLAAVDRGVQKSTNREKQLCWVLDPIDGTQGLLSIQEQQCMVGLALLDEEGEPIVAAMGNPCRAQHSVLVAVREHGIRYWDAVSGQGPYFVPELSDAELVGECNSDPWSRGCELKGDDANKHMKADFDYPPYLVSRPKIKGSPMPFGPQCPPSELCCGSLVKYAAVAQGSVAGFVQFQDSDLKVWDHAAGILSVLESGGTVVDGKGNPVRLGVGRTFSVTGGIICVAKQTKSGARQCLLNCL